MRASFAHELDGLQRRLIAQLQSVADVLDRLVDGVPSAAAQSAPALFTAAGTLRRVSRSIDADLVVVAARRAPVAEHLRLVLALLQLAHGGMLIANQLTLIGEQLRRLDGEVRDRQETGSQISLMTSLAATQLRRALEAFVARDPVAAREIERQDDALDRVNRQVFSATADLDSSPEQRELAFRYVLVARSLERIGDNAVDIAEQAEFLVTAELHEFNDASRPKRRGDPT
jgi:phosphate transport system protein